MQKWANNSISTLSAAINGTDVSIFIQAPHGSRFPQIVAPDFCYCTLEDATGNIEIVKVTAHSVGGSSFTVTRAQQSTTARSFAIGDLFELRFTAQEATTWEADIDALESTRARKAGETYTGVHNFSGATSVALPAATNIGNVSQTEIMALDGITANVQGQLNARGLIDGQVWTGVHQFPSTTSIGIVSALEITALDGIGANIQAQIDDLDATKADLAGAIYTGAHDFSAATVTFDTLPTVTNDARAATTAFVQQAAFASYANLPANPGDQCPRDLNTVGGIVAWQPRWNDLAAFAAGLV